MGSVGDSYGNALMENFWSTLKIELVYRTSWRTRDGAENAIFEYIDTGTTPPGSRKSSATSALTNSARQSALKRMRGSAAVRECRLSRVVARRVRPAASFGARSRREQCS
jgi:hypothetical protein